MDENVEDELKRQLDILEFGISEITPRDEFLAMLRHSIQNQTPLRVKCGIDPTRPDIHIGHTVPYRKMRQFQDLGHIGVVIIGDYTASIGDPTGKNEQRPSLDEETIKQNTQNYMKQVYTVVDPERTEVYYQSEWFSDVGLRDIVHWGAQTTVAKLLGHETFGMRIKEGNPLSLHELFYPVLQGIDSVYVKADVELGGTDQKFNVLMGRDYQRNANLRPQVAMLLPIIRGTCGKEKMSKSLDNSIGVLDDPFDQFGKVMSVPDDLMLEYFEHVTDIDPKEFLKVKEGLESGALHPNETKKKLASMIVAFFHGKNVGEEMRQRFEAVFKKGGVPDDAPEVEFKRGESILNIVAESGLVQSKKEIRRLIESKAIGILDGDKITDPNFILDSSFAGEVIKIGKRKFLVLK